MPLWRKSSRLHNLKRPKVRQDMKKENLYNLARMKPQFTRSRTFFQQKWTAKAVTRAYHGEQIREKQWARMFDRNTHSVIPMDPQYLANNDGRDQSSGRGAGLELPPDQRATSVPKTPFTQMLYHPIERRLDTAIFRALFASSTRQARQHVTHGHVKVNGKLIRQPGYMLNPGDMFQVEPDRVMFSLGAPKEAKAAGPAETEGEIVEGEAAAEVPQAEADAEADGSAMAEEDLASELQLLDDAQVEGDTEGDSGKPTRDRLKDFRIKTKEYLQKPGMLNNKLKQELRAFSKDIRSGMSKASKLSPSDLDDLSTRMEDLTMKVKDRREASAESQSQDSASLDEQPSQTDALLEEILDQARENPLDPSKPYATPWKPRDYMSAFAFIPRYLEVNQKICSAVYLRHPVCYPGIGEVPTPFSLETGQLTFNWYLKRR